MLLTKIYVCSLVSPVLTTCLLTVSLGLFCCCFLTKCIIICQLHTCIQWNRIRFILIVVYSWPSSLPTCPLSQLHGFFFANKKYFLVIYIVLHWIMGSLPVVTPLKKSNSLSPCSYQVTTAPQLGVVTWQSLSHPWWNLVWISLIQVLRMQPQLIWGHECESHVVPRGRHFPALPFVF